MSSNTTTIPNIQKQAIPGNHALKYLISTPSSIISSSMIHPVLSIPKVPTNVFSIPTPMQKCSKLAPQPASSLLLNFPHFSQLEAGPLSISLIASTTCFRTILIKLPTAASWLFLRSTPRNINNLPFWNKSMVLQSRTKI